MPRLTHLPLLRLLGLAVFCGISHGATAQPVYKCEVGGKSTYQSQPCNDGKASAVSIVGGPTAADAAAARHRAAREKQDAALVTRTPTPRAAGGFSGGSAGGAQSPQAGDCERLARQREQAYGRRNAALNQARRSEMGVSAGSREDQAIGQMNVNISGLEASMQSRGCKLD
jgi:hypothetical protein